MAHLPLEMTGLFILLPLESAFRGQNYRISEWHVVILIWSHILTNVPLGVSVNYGLGNQQEFVGHHELSQCSGYGELS